MDITYGVFQSTLPVWGATWVTVGNSGTLYHISIHAPRVGSDSVNPEGQQ